MEEASYDKYEKLYPKTMRDLLQKKVEKKYLYSKKRIPIGVNHFGRVVFLDMSQPIRLALIAMNRTGKTLVMRGISDRLKDRRVGAAVVWLTDIKNECWTSIMPVQEEFQHMLLEGEKPTRQKIVEFRPTFFKSVDKNLCPEGNRWLSLNPARMTQTDFLTILSVSGMTPPQQNLMSIIFKKLETEFEGKDKSKFTMEWIDKVIDGIEGIQDSQISPLKIRFEPFKNSNFYEPEHDVDIVELIKRGWTIAINLERFDEFYGSNFNPPPVAVSLILRQVVNARIKKEIPEVWFLVDECSRFMPTDRSICSKRDLMESVDVTAQYATNFIFATQNLSKMPPEVIKQCRYILVPANADIETLKDTLKMCGVLKSQQNSYNEARRYKQQMGQWEWLLIDRNTNRLEIIKPLAPLSHHRKSRE